MEREQSFAVIFKIFGGGALVPSLLKFSLLKVWELIKDTIVKKCLDMVFPLSTSTEDQDTRLQNLNQLTILLAKILKTTRQWK